MRSDQSKGTLTYTPRLLSINFQGSLGSVSSKGTLYNEDSSAPSERICRAGNVSSHASEPRKKNLFLQSLYQEEQGAPLMNGINGGAKDSQNEIQDTDMVSFLDTGVQFWTDLSKVHYHPQSLYEVNGLWMDAQEFDNYGMGQDVFMENLRGEEICDRLRFFIEECDHVQEVVLLQFLKLRMQSMVHMEVKHVGRCSAIYRRPDALLPFPSIFGNLVGQHGELLASPILCSASRGCQDDGWKIKEK
ncbi:hypothetical protein GQ457_02G023830 [Hibiscus cannabinus]